MTDQHQTFLKSLDDAVEQQSLRKVVVSKPAKKSSECPSRLDLRPVRIKEQTLLQLTQRIGNQDHHENLTFDQARTLIINHVPASHLDCLLVTDKQEIMARFSRKGVCRVKVKSTDANSQTSSTATVAADHNKARNYLIPEGIPCPFLIETGVMTSDGKVRSKHYRKFRQINRYVEFVRDIVSELPTDETIRIVDFGCGKSYLTFATHHLLTNILNRKVDIRGLDQRADVVATCQGIVERLQLTDLMFQQSLISDYQPDSHIHLVVSLHACDTATDDALANAVLWNSEVILAVPCCQHELASKLQKSAEPVFSDHGILHERFASLATDALRAQWLNAVGYETSVMEFIDMQHTAKNILIKAIRTRNGGRSDRRQVSLKQIADLQQRLKLEPLTLERKLRELGLLTDVAGLKDEQSLVGPDGDVQ